MLLSPLRQLLDRLSRIIPTSRRPLWPARGTRLSLEILEERLPPTVNLAISNPAPFLKPDTGQSLGMFVVTRSGDLPPSVQVDYATQDGTGANGAHAGTDYVSTSGTLNFAPNQTTATIAVPVLGNNIFQADKTFTVSLTNPTPNVVSFASQQPFGPGIASQSVAVGDFNGDGKPDLAFVNGSSVSVLLNTTPAGATTPSFAPPQTFATGIGPISVAVGDFNGDGRLDLAVANFGSDTVSVLLNTTPIGAATASFAFQRTFATGSSPNSVAVGDFNRDGKPDLVVANDASDTISVLLNTTPAGATTSRFTTQQTFATGHGPFGVAVADLNGDGKLDLAVATVDSNAVSVLLNNSTQTQITLSGSPATGTISSALEAPMAVAFVVGTSPQSAVVNTAFAMPLAVDVRNASGTLVQNVSVTFTAPSSGPSGQFGSGTSVTIVTNALGRATAPTFAANTMAGNFQVTAQAAGGSNPSTNFSLTNSPGAPAVLTAVAGGNQSATVNTAFGTNLLATLTDQFGNRVPGVTVTFTAPSSGASANFPGGNTGTTDANGQVSDAITANTLAGTYSITALASGGGNPTSTFLNLTNTSAAATSVTLTGLPASLVAGAPVPLTATLRDPYNNVATGYTGTIAFTGTDDNATLPPAYTFTATDAGVHTFVGVILRTTGIRFIIASDTADDTIDGVSRGVTVVAAAPDHYTVTTTAANPDVAGTPFDVTVTVLDLYGNTATGYTGTAHFTSFDPYGATLPADYTFQPEDQGTHTFPGGATLYTAGTWDVTATDTATGSITGNAILAVSPAAADHLLFIQQPTDTTAGQIITPAVTVGVVDQFGNVVTNDNTDTVTLAIGTNPGGGTLSGTLTVTVSNGIATFSDLSIDQIGDGYTLNATAAGLTAADPAAFRITA